MHDSMLHLLGNTMSDSTVYRRPRALFTITTKVFHLMILYVGCPHILPRCMHGGQQCVTFSALR